MTGGQRDRHVTFPPGEHVQLAVQASLINLPSFTVLEPSLHVSSAK